MKYKKIITRMFFCNFINMNVFTFLKNPNNFLFFQIQIRSIMNDDFRSQFLEDKISRFGNL